MAIEISEAKTANRDGYDAGINGYGFHNPINPWKRDVWRAWNDGFVEGQQARREQVNVASLSDFELRSICRSTSRGGRYAPQLEQAIAELKRRGARRFSA